MAVVIGVLVVKVPVVVTSMGVEVGASVVLVTIALLWEWVAVVISSVVTSGEVSVLKVPWLMSKETD